MRRRNRSNGNGSRFLFNPIFAADHIKIMTNLSIVIPAYNEESGIAAIVNRVISMRVFKREILERIYPLPDGLNLTPIMSTRAIHEGIQMVEIPIPYSERVGRL
jgi:hypothetical protein